MTNFQLLRYLNLAVLYKLNNQLNFRMATAKKADDVRHFFSPGTEPNVHVCNLCRVVRKQNVSHGYANLLTLPR